jgi:hypothetical protein
VLENTSLPDSTPQRHAATIPGIKLSHLVHFKCSSISLRENEEILHRVKEERNKVCTTKRSKASWIGLVLFKNCLLKHVIEGKREGRIEVTGRRGRRSNKLLDDNRKRNNSGN